MKKIVCFLLLIFFAFCYTKAVQAAAGETPRVYAVVIGISDYQSPGIDKLEYAHKDAAVFAEYLQSPAGGSVPEDHIILLQNEKATFSAIYNALDWLVETCHENDLVYFYFSGHGDMENNTIYKLGFLISYNTPRTNYINNAIRIEDLNNYANTLSVKTKARVVIITDACHSGNLAGNDFKGNMLVGEQLKTVMNNEIRITSCAPDQLSVEDRKWGGGRGVFSYYLLKGLAGKADIKKDGKISVKEISDYLDQSLSSDVVLKEKKHIQTPVIKGKSDFSLATFDPNQQGLADNDLVAAPVPVVGDMPFDLPPLPKSDMAAFFNLLERKPFELYCHFDTINQVAPNEAPQIFLEQILRRFEAGDTNVVKITPEQLEGFRLLPKQLESNPDARKRFAKKFVELISNRGQDIINNFLSGDEAEIERRRYYNTIANDYSVYVTMFEVAGKLADPKTPLAKILAIKYHYFKAVSCRLKIFNYGHADSLIALALDEQKKALALEENAAYIHNDLGALYNLKGDTREAEKYFLKAADIAPQWVVPIANLINVYYLAGQFDKALTMSAKADSLQPGFYGTMLRTGMVWEKKENFLWAEEFYRQCIKVNNRHYLPFERLGNVYVQTSDYFLADSFYHEAELRKQGFNGMLAYNRNPEAEADGLLSSLIDSCGFPDKINDNDVITLFVKARQLRQSDAKESELLFKKVIRIDQQNPLAYQYLGKMMWNQQRWAEADILFNRAIACYLDTVAFNAYVSKYEKLMTIKSDCILKSFKNAYYHRLDDYFLLADVYTNWNHFSEAEETYAKVIEISPEFRGTYCKLWQLYEMQFKYHDAEALLLRYRPLFPDGLAQLNAFYRRVAIALPESGEWFYRAGNFHYFEVKLHPDLYTADRYRNYADDDILKTDIDNLGTYLSPGLGNRFELVSTIYGTGESTKMGELVPHPKRRAILYLLKADALLSDKENLADINAKIGDMFVALNSSSDAAKYYAKASQLKGVNAGTRLKLIDCWNENFCFRDARKQLDTLWQRAEINFQKMVLLARYCVHAGEFNFADTVLARAKAVHPLPVREIDQLYARRNLLSKKYPEAFTAFENYLSGDAHDAATLYALARISCLLGKNEESLKWLEKAVVAGFNCYWVLKYDAVWNKLRSNKAWQEITKDIHQRPFTQLLTEIDLN